MNFTEFLTKSQHLTGTYQVTPEVYRGFQTLSGDNNPLHTDIVFAKAKGFPECVMYGNILNAFLSHFVGMVLPSPEVMIQTQDIQYRKPVYLGDEILIVSEIQEWSEVVEVINFKLKFYRCNKDEKQIVATGHVQIGMLHDKN